MAGWPEGELFAYTYVSFKNIFHRKTRVEGTTGESPKEIKSPPPRPLPARRPKKILMTKSITQPCFASYHCLLSSRASSSLTLKRTLPSSCLSQKNKASLIREAAARHSNRTLFPCGFPSHCFFLLMNDSEMNRGGGGALQSSALLFFPPFIVQIWIMRKHDGALILKQSDVNTQRQKLHRKKCATDDDDDRWETDEWKQAKSTRRQLFRVPTGP